MACLTWNCLDVWQRQCEVVSSDCSLIQCPHESLVVLLHSLEDYC